MTGPVRAVVRDSLHRGLQALVWTAVIAGLAVIGAGFLLVAAVIGLSTLLGPFLACVILGLGLLVLALMIAVLRRGRPAAAPRSPPPGPDPSTLQLSPLSEVAFVLGFVAARTLLRRRDPPR